KDNFVPVKIRNFYRFESLPYDAFLELSETKFVKIINRGDLYTEADIQKYIMRGVKFIYLEKDEHLTYLITMSNNLIGALQHKHPFAEMLSYQIKAASVIHEHIRTIGITTYIVDLTNIVIQRSILHFKEIDNLRDFLSMFPFVLRDSAERAL